MSKPDKIYLQVDGYDPGDEFDPAGMSWSEDKINDSDIEYIRADLANGTIITNRRELQRRREFFKTRRFHKGDRRENERREQ